MMRKLNSLQRSLNTLDHSHTHAHEHLRGRKWKAKKTQKKNQPTPKWIHTETQRHTDTDQTLGNRDAGWNEDGKRPRWNETQFFCLSFGTVMIYYDRVLFRMEKTHFGIKKNAAFFCCLIICWFFSVNDKLMDLFSADWLLLPEERLKKKIIISQANK